MLRGINCPVTPRGKSTLNPGPPSYYRADFLDIQTRSGTPSRDRFGDRATGYRSSVNGIFRKEGEFWTLGYGGNYFRLKDTKGLGYIAHLLRHPGAEFHVLDLAGGIAAQPDEDQVRQTESALPRGDEDLERAGIHIGGLGDAGEMLDEEAKAAYRRRLSERREDLRKAKEHGNIERAEQAEQEIDALTRELSRAIGLGGRDRRAISASERARQNVSKTIKSALDRIRQSDTELADIFARCIRTGNFCSYRPDPDFPIAWAFGVTTVEQEVPPSRSGEPAPTLAHHSQATPVMLEVLPFSLAERTPFVGRDSEVSMIREVVDRALTGRGSLIMLMGEPGVGKSRLAIEVAEYASGKGFGCSIGHCYESEEPVPYLAFAEIIENHIARAASLDDYRRCVGDSLPELAQIAPSLRRVFPDISEPMELPPAQQRGYLFQCFSETLARLARTRPQLLVLEDLHWADESTLTLLSYLVNQIVRHPIVIIATYRDKYSEENPVLVRTLEELIRLGVRPLKLGGLIKEAVAQMLQRSAQRHLPESLVTAIFEESQGNPFFVQEVYRHLIEEGKVFDAAGQFRTDLKIDEIEVPENVRLIIGRRLQRLNENEKRVLTAAAVIGRSFSFRLLTAVNHMDVDELFIVVEKAQRMGIIVSSAEGPEKPFTFGHELVRQTLLAAISAPRRGRMHASVAEAIERLNPDAVNERAGEIVDHLLKAGSFVDAQKLIRWLTQAGRNALDAAAFEDARRNFRSALSHQGALDPRQKADLLTSLAMAERGLDQWNAVLANLREAHEIYIDLGDREMIGKSFTKLTDALIWVGRFQEATETARRGLDYFQEVSADRARLLTTLGRALAFAAGYGPAEEALQEALSIASELSDPKLEVVVLADRSTVNYHFLRLREIADDAIRGEQVGCSEASPWQRAQQLHILHQTLLYLGRPEEALRIADLHEPLARKIGNSYSVALCLTTRAWVEFGKALNLSKLETCLRRVAESSETTPFGFSEVFYKVQLSQVDFFRGNWTSALLHAQASRRHESGSFSPGLGVGTLFQQLAYGADRAGALAILDEERARLPLSGQPNTRGSWWMLALMIEGLVMLGEQSQAGQLYPIARELVGTGAVVLWPNFRFTQTIAGIAAAAAGQWEAAEDHFQIAMQQAESFPYLLEQTEIRRFQAMMLLDRAAGGDRERAQMLLNEALEIYTKIGMLRHVEITQSLIDRARP